MDTPWAVKLPRSVGEHPLLGFQPLHDPNLEVLPEALKLRHVNSSAYARDGRPQYRSLSTLLLELLTWRARCPIHARMRFRRPTAPNR
jgi:hypothetical protein